LHPSVIFFSSLFIAPYLAAEDQPLGRNRWAATVGPQPLRRLITPSWCFRFSSNFRSSLFWKGLRASSFL